MGLVNQFILLFGKRDLSRFHTKWIKKIGTLFVIEGQYGRGRGSFPLVEEIEFFCQFQGCTSLPDSKILGSCSQKMVIHQFQKKSTNLVDYELQIFFHHRVLYVSFLFDEKNAPALLVLLCYLEKIDLTCIFSWANLLKDRVSLLK